MRTISSFVLTMLLSLNVMAQSSNENGSSKFPELNESDRRLLLEQVVDIQGMMLMRHRGGNGGDSIAAEFTTIAKNASTILDDICLYSNSDLCAYREDFANMMDKDSASFVKVLSAPSVLAYDDKPRDAVNFVDANGQRHIIVGADRWDEINSDYYGKHERKFILVIHEYFSLLGLESSDFYPKSNELYSLIEMNGYKLSKISSNKQLAEKCSIKIEQHDSLEESHLRDIQTFMTDRNYEIKDSETQARFLMKTTLTCQAGSLFKADTCSVYTEIVDNYKYREVVYDKHETHSAWMRMNKVQDIVFNNALSGIETCR